MPEEAIETQELKERLDDAREASEHEREGTPWIMWLSLSTAIIAVLAAIAALASGAYANDAMLEKNDAVLHQSKADDAWAYYQAKGIEAAFYSTQAESAPRPELAARWHAEGERQRSERTEIRRKAEEEEARVAEMDRESTHSLHVHHRFATSVTIFQVAIALAAIAALTRRKAMWWVSLAVGGVGTVFFVFGILAR
jgi:hypothetical protein